MVIEGFSQNTLKLSWVGARLDAKKRNIGDLARTKLHQTSGWTERALLSYTLYLYAHTRDTGYRVYVMAEGIMPQSQAYSKHH